ncbi:MAG TPA: hypothetical protein VGF38_05675 [Ktedonobacterales bacterium]|jgi:hypothetical protein
MTGEPARARRFRLPPGEWVRQHIVQIVTLIVIVVLIFACCNPSAWPTVVWQLVGHNCGIVQGNISRVTSSGATQAETCFAQAYQHCSAATLGASFIDLDYSASYTFVIEPYGFTCAVGALWRRSGHTPFPFSGGPGIGYCGGVQLAANGLSVRGCQSIGDVFVPGGA